jgi:hypothetical protein
MSEIRENPVIDLCCPHCGGTVWRSEYENRRGPDGEMSATHKFTCDACAARRERDATPGRPESVPPVVAGREYLSVAKELREWKAAYGRLKDVLKAERAAHKTTKADFDEVNALALARLRALDAAHERIRELEARILPLVSKQWPKTVAEWWGR